MKKYTVLAVYVNNKLHQLLKKSEARFISQLVQNFKTVTVTLMDLDEKQYKANFG